MDVNEVLGTIWLAVFTPAFVACMVWFWRRRELQPIKARQPGIVTLQNLMFLIFTVTLAVQRIVVDDYPCWLQLWSSYIGMIVLGNVFLARCFTLHMKFNHTRKIAELEENQMLRSGTSRFNRTPGATPAVSRRSSMRGGGMISDSPSASPGNVASGSGSDDEDVEMGVPPPDYDPDEEDEKMQTRMTTHSPMDDLDVTRSSTLGEGIARVQEHMDVTCLNIRMTQKMIGASRQWKVLTVLSCLMLISPLVVTVTSEGMRSHKGDGCQKKWEGAAFVLGFFAAVYLVIFLYFAWLLRGRFDSFRIKEELRATAIVGVIVLIPWYLLNNIDSLVDGVNEDFPISTVLLWFFSCFVLGVSCVWPIYLSIKGVKVPEFEPPEKIATLEQLLRNKTGHDSFKDFLKGEFSVENLIFWSHCEEYHRQVAEARSKIEAGTAPPHTFKRIVKAAQVILRTYVEGYAPLEINLSHSVQQAISDTMDELLDVTRGALPKDWPTELFPKAADVYRRAQEDIFKLMESDPFKRYVRTEGYRQLCHGLEAQAREHQALVDVGVL